ncbi:GNAT family N-acetyltransferase [Deinococcus humi]|uniref:RimJ/RimL family protein N-acetyltransferase n=1 Tax=Deinococcus humi TaxID=662880 RepID=A0A7W8JWR8_9DEIO|nr:GNAT family protein [Deinococcus humi]MBB5363363.1 RimJ/RimL family protein N-acetyltransferase [Deinococcus humi]GGO26891.1 acetyltransferase [Deinococcus humi]
MTAHRVVLRHLRPEDAPLLVAYRNDPEVFRFQSWVLPYTLARAGTLIEEMHSRTPGQPGWTQLALADASTDELLGDFAVNGASSGSGSQAEIGFTLARHAQGRGLASEGLQLLLTQLFGTDGLHRVYAHIDPGNAPSAALLVRAGFRHEGTALESYWHRGTWTDDALYGLLAREWHNQK